MPSTRHFASLGIKIALPAEGTLLLVIGAFGQEQAVTSILSIVFGSLTVLAFVDVVRERSASPARDPWTMPTVIVSQAAVLPYFILPLWAEYFSAVNDPLDITIVAIVLVGAIIASSVLVAAWYVRPTTGNKTVWTIALAMLPLLSSAQFWYSTIYKPNHDRPDVNVEASLVGTNVRNNLREVTANVTISNDGPATVDFLDAAYTLTAFDSAPVAAHLAGTSFRFNGETAWSDGSGSYRGLMQTGRLIRPSGHLVPGQKLLTTFTFAVNASTADKIRLTVFLSTIADTGTSMDDPRNCATTSGVILCEEVPVPISGWISSNLLDHPIARTELIVPRSGVPYLRTRFKYGDDSRLPPQATYGFLNSRRFTTSVEYNLLR